jgi:tRNA A-37 threonylcarbamoyl transferase component Bud32
VNRARQPEGAQPPLAGAAASTSASAPGDADAQIGPYRRLDRLGEGAMGEVYRALDTMLEREVALKTLRPEMSARADLVERFRVEAIALARLHHRHIATVYAFFRDGSQHHIAMQYLRGRTLDAELRTRGRLPWREAAAVAIDVLLALEHAHALGVIHRDLKPANLMIDPEGRTVVMDFGIARVLVKDRQTRAGTLVGTLEYIAPEIVRGEDADARSDLYALGCVLYEMVTGELPFQGASDFALMRAHAEQAPPPPRQRARELPAALEAIILRALAKRPGDRFADAQGFRAALQAAQAEAPADGARPAWPGLAAVVRQSGSFDALHLLRPLRDLRAIRALRALCPLRDLTDLRAIRAAQALGGLRDGAGRAFAWLELPRHADCSAWASWLRANPGLAGAMLVAAGAVCMSLAWGALSWRASVAGPSTLPAASAARPDGASERGATPVAMRTAQEPTVPLADPQPVAAPFVSQRRPAAPVFEMPPPPQPRINVERAQAPAPRDATDRLAASPPAAPPAPPPGPPSTRQPTRQSAPSSVPLSASPAPAPPAAEPRNGGWYVKH